MSASTLTKQRRDAPAGFFAAERAGLAWIASVPGAPPVPRVASWSERHIELVRVPTEAPTAAAAERFGRQLAALHHHTPATFGAAWPGFIGTLAMDNTPRTGHWAAWWRDWRVRPLLEPARLARADRAAVEEVLGGLDHLAGPDEPPCLLHGDLWSGNVLWGTGGQVWLIDPAAHGGHRETDLAMLSLFGVPFLETIIAAYDAAYPLAPGWQARRALHQLWPVLVHAVLFGGGYGAQAGHLARSLR